MIQEIKKGWGAYQAAKDGHSLALMEGLTGCNRRCPHCDVWKKGNSTEASTITGTFGQIKSIHQQGFSILNYVGGEPGAGCQFEGGVATARYGLCRYGKSVLVEDYRERLVPYTSKEGLTYAEHTLRVVKYASQLGMITNVTTNGDFLDNTSYLGKLKRAGLDFLTFSLHSYNRSGLVDIIQKAKATAEAGIIPIVSVVFTADRARTIPQYARTCAANGVLFSTAVVQEIGGGFSSIPAKSQIPTPEQQREVFEALGPLKRAGFVRNNLNYLRNALDYPGNSWRCNPERDLFIHIRAVGEKGEVGVCSEVRTGFDTSIDLKSEAWRQRKRELVENCRCLYSCFYEAENPYFRGDLRTLVPMVLIKSGYAGLARMLGRRTIEDPSEIIPVPQSELEKSQARLNDYYKLHNKIKRRGLDLVHVIETPFVAFALVLSFPLMIVFEEIRERMASRKGN